MNLCKIFTGKYQLLKISYESVMSCEYEQYKNIKTETLSATDVVFNAALNAYLR